jgi:hypothetical protein
MSGILCPGSGIRKCWHYREIVMIVWHAYFLIPHAWGKADSLSEQVTFRFTMIENGYRQNKDPAARFLPFVDCQHLIP